MKKHEPMKAYGIPPSVLEKARPIYERLGEGQMQRVRHVSFIDAARALGYKGSLISKSGGYRWVNSIEMIMDLCWYNEEEAHLFIVSKFPYVYSKSAYGQVWF